jgi:glutathionyl-hydroquinone reductase
MLRIRNAVHYILREHLWLKLVSWKFQIVWTLYRPTVPLTQSDYRLYTQLMQFAITRTVFQNVLTQSDYRLYTQLKQFAITRTVFQNVLTQSDYRLYTQLKQFAITCTVFQNVTNTKTLRYVLPCLLREKHKITDASTATCTVYKQCTINHRRQYRNMYSI